MPSFKTLSAITFVFSLCLVAGCSAPTEAESGVDESNLEQVGDPAGDEADEYGMPLIPEDLPSALRNKVKGLVGKWTVKTQSADSNCGPNADATVRVYQTYEAEWDAPGDIAPPGGQSFSVSIECGDGASGQTYFAKADSEPSLYGFYILPEEGVCSYSVDWGTEETGPTVDPNKMFCQKSTLSTNKLTGKVTTYSRKNPVELDDWFASSDLAEFDVVSDAPACSASLSLSGSELKYVYDCNGERATFTFTR